MKRAFTYGSVCSGIEAATVAWKPLGWKAIFFSETESFPRAVLANHYPRIPLEDDFRNINPSSYDKPDLLVGGTPCQTFSYSGKRQGMDDPRGNLALEFFRLAQRLKARWIVWENVPGVLTSNKRKDFETILREISKCGYGFAWRILDAQYFGIPQSRRRLFLVGHSSACWQYPAAVLFDSKYLFERPETANRQKIKLARQTGQLSGRDCEGRLIYSSTGDISYCISTEMRLCNPTHETYVFYPRQRKVRSFTIQEAEALQGFSRDYTAIPWRGKPVEDCPLSHRFKAVGNSMPVPVMRWIGTRIQFLDNHLRK